MTEKANPNQQIDGVVLPRRFALFKDGLYRVAIDRRRKPKEGEDIEPTPSGDHTAPAPMGIFQTHERLTTEPVWISRSGATVGAANAETEHLVELACIPHEDSHTGRRTRWVRRESLASSSALVKLSTAGFPFDQTNALAVIDYFAQQRVGGFIPSVRVAKRVGYVEDPNLPDVHGWMFGREWIGPREHATVLAPGSAGRMESALSCRGDLKGWLDMLAAVSASRGKIARWLIWASFAAPLLRFIQERTLIIHHYGASSAGKSALAKFAAAAFGSPALKETMNRTAKSFLGPFQWSTDLPVVFDELQSVDREVREQLGQVIYQITEQQQRQGLNVDGTSRDTGAGFRSVVRFTGEENLIGEGSGIADLGGQSNRVLQFEASVLTDDLASEVNKWVDRAEHYGHAGRLFLTALSRVTNDPGTLAELRDLHEHARAAVSAALGKQPRVGSLAAVVIAETLAHRWVLGQREGLEFTADDLSQSNAFKWAVEDAVAVVGAINADPSGRRSLLDQVVAFLRGHRMSRHDLYIETHTPAGKEQLSSMSWKQAAGFVRHMQEDRPGQPQEGKYVTEIAYPGQVIEQAMRDADLPPARCWNELRRAGLLFQRPSDTGYKQMHRLPGVTGVGPQRCYIVRLPLLTDAPPTET